MISISDAEISTVQLVRYLNLLKKPVWINHSNMLNFFIERGVWYNFCSDPSWGGEELYTRMGFFVQSILADRYIHPRELRLVSLESLSSVEYGNKKIFLIFVFYRELSRFEKTELIPFILFIFSGTFD